MCIRDRARASPKPFIDPQQRIQKERRASALFRTAPHLFIVIDTVYRNAFSAIRLQEGLEGCKGTL